MNAIAFNALFFFSLKKNCMLALQDAPSSASVITCASKVPLMFTLCSEYDTGVHLSIPVLLHRISDLH